MVVLSGLIGANFGATILDMAGIKDAVARGETKFSFIPMHIFVSGIPNYGIGLGLGIGAAAHGLGTAAFADEKEAFPFAAISMALTATGATVLASIPVVKKTLLRVTLGV
jgi:putative effector of murein hydrolase